MSRTDLPRLPCYPCPHGASCCAYGTTLSAQEARQISRDRGPHTIYKTRWGEWRTRIRQGRCVFYVNGGCELHAKEYYPAVCRGFPWVDAETGGPYQYDRTICGELAARPELVVINPYVARRGSAP